MKTVLYISPNSPFESIGGVERYLMNLIKHARAQAASRTILLVPSFHEDYVTHDGTITIIGDSSLVLSSAELNDNRKISMKTQAFARVVTDIIAQYDIGAICAENFHLGLPAGYSLQLHMVSNLNEIPVVLKLHSFAATDLQTELVNQLPWQKISCVSKSVAGDCFHKGADIDAITIDYLGVNTDEFTKKSGADVWLRDELHIGHEKRIVMTASRIVLGSRNILEEKGILDTIRSFSRLVVRYPELHLLIAVGKPPETLAEEFNQAKDVLMGYLKLNGVIHHTTVRSFSLDEMPQVYSGANVFVLPSENETFGQVFIEAMACELPVVGTKVGGIPEIIHDNVTGFLIVPSDPITLSQRIETLVYDESKRKKIITAAKKSVKEWFNAKDQFDKFDNELREIVE